MLDPSTMRRLAFIKGLYEIAAQQSRQAEPMNAASVLTFHDSVELFLRLALEHKDAVGKTDLRFLEYWDKLQHQISNGLTQKESMRRLADARGNLKHQGRRPAREDVEEYRVMTTRFFEENTRIVFDVDFANISMIGLVQPPAARQSLKQSASLIEIGDVRAAIMKLRMAFDQVIDDYQNNTGFGIRQLRRIGSLSPAKYTLTYESGIKDPNARKVLGKVIKETELVRTQLRTLQEATNIVALGLDYQRYTRFSEATRFVKKNARGGYIDVMGDYPQETPPSIEDCRVCFDFILDSALRIQEFGLEAK